MNLKDRLDQLSRRPISKDAVPLADLDPMSKDEVLARGVAVVRRDLEARGFDAKAIDSYLGRSDVYHDVAIAV
jgi:hypothetical protein